MIELKNILSSCDLSYPTNSAQNPIELFGILLESSSRDFKTGYKEIVDCGESRIIRDFTLVYSDFLHGPIDIIDLPKVKDKEYLQGSKKAHDVLEVLKSEGIVEPCIEIPVEYNILGRTWRQYYDGVELGTLSRYRPDILKKALQKIKNDRNELKDLGYTEREMQNIVSYEKEIIEDFESKTRLHASEIEKIPIYRKKIYKTLKTLWKKYGIVNYDYHEYNVIIGKKNTIAIIDGWWHD